MRITLADALNVGRGTERPFSCPEHDDAHASASVNVDLGVWVCFTCRAHGVILDHVPAADAAIRILAGDLPPRVFPATWLELFNRGGPSPYWAQRYGADIAEWFGTGTHYLTGKPTYPMRSPGRGLLGVVQRNLDGEKPKYIYPSGARTSAALFIDPGPRFIPATVVVLVEGASDVMALSQSRVPTHWEVCGTYGSGLHAPQVDLLKVISPKLIVAAFDDDPAGARANAMAIEQCADIAPVLVHHWAPSGGKDPGECPTDTRVNGLRDLLRANRFTALI